MSPTYENLENPFGPDPWEITVERPFVDRDVTAVRLSVQYPGGIGKIEAMGSARRHPSDDWDPVIGRSLALGRALKNLGAQLETFGNVKVLENCHQGDAHRPTQAEIEEFWADPPESFALAALEEAQTELGYRMES